jgi:hypothetical protein
MLSVSEIQTRPLTRPIFDTSLRAMRSREIFGFLNWDVLHAWYAAVAAEAAVAGEEMPDVGTFMDVQYDIERSIAGLTIETLADRKYAPEREPRFRSWEDRAANDAGVRRFGEL